MGGVPRGTEGPAVKRKTDPLEKGGLVAGGKEKFARQGRPL